MNLNLDNNWRRVLLLTKQADRNIDQPVSYILLDKNNLPCSIQKFCEQFSYEYSFDYDTESKYIWPLHDNIQASELVNILNKDFPKCAQLINKAPSSVHNLNFNDFDDLNF